MPRTPASQAIRFRAMAAEMAMRIGARIRQRREELDLTQEDVARLMPGKTAGNQVSRWERGTNRPGDAQLAHLATALGVDVSYFMVPEKTEEPPDVAGRLSISERRLDRLETAVAELANALGITVQLPAEDEDGGLPPLHPALRPSAPIAAPAKRVRRQPAPRRAGQRRSA